MNLLTTLLSKLTGTAVTAETTVVGQLGQIATTPLVYAGFCLGMVAGVLVSKL